jgi:hypothetical protein
MKPIQAIEADQTSLLLNVQPVIPVALTLRWNLISRTIVPFLDAPAPAGERFRGLGDIQEQLFFTPARPKGLIWGLGPFFSFPTATAEAISTSPLLTADWDAPSGNQWTVPFGLGITKTTVFARQPTSIGAQYDANLVRPDSAPASQLRATISLLFPTHTARAAPAAARTPRSVSNSAR